MREYSEKEEEIKNPKNSVEYIILKQYCVSYKKNTANENSIVRKTKQKRLMLFTRCRICGKKTLNFIKNKKINNFNDYWKQVSIDWRQTYARIKYKPGFTYSVCGPFTKHCERILRFREIVN